MCDIGRLNFETLNSHMRRTYIRSRIICSHSFLYDERVTSIAMRLFLTPSRACIDRTTCVPRSDRHVSERTGCGGRRRNAKRSCIPSVLNATADRETATRISCPVGSSLLTDGWHYCGSRSRTGALQAVQSVSKLTVQSVWV